MTPRVDVHRLASDEYSYEVSVGGAPAHASDSAFDSLENCLRDAGCSLDRYFPRIELKYNGLSLGALATHLFRRESKRLAERIEPRKQPA